MRLFMYTHSGNDNTPLYLKTFSKGANFLSGFHVDQIYGNSISLMRLEYRLKYKTDIYFHLILNNIFNTTINNQLMYNNIPSFGVGTTLISRAGNVEINIGSGPALISDLSSYQYNISISAGYKF